MEKIIFVCHGNICRSPMAEFVMKDLCEKKGVSSCFEISSAATSREEIGNPVHPGTARCLTRHGIPFSFRRARQITLEDIENSDRIVVMDNENHRALLRIAERGGKEFSLKAEKKVSALGSYCGRGEVADPWYTGDFDETWRDVFDGCTAFLDCLISEGEC